LEYFPAKKLTRASRVERGIAYQRPCSVEPQVTRAAESKRRKEREGREERKSGRKERGGREEGKRGRQEVERRKRHCNVLFPLNPKSLVLHRVRGGRREEGEGREKRERREERGEKREKEGGEGREVED
jgi:hypothetical protein